MGYEHIRERRWKLGEIGIGTKVTEGFPDIRGATLKLRG